MAGFVLVEELPNYDPRAGRVMVERRPHSARWTGHASGVEFVFLWRVGRLEVGALEEDGGMTFALSHFDAALQSKCVEICAAVGAYVDHGVWPLEHTQKRHHKAP